ncbi:MAG: hypothetical protein BWY95_01337 [Bacteroidetes bacterium ADurb.BinA104]|nr:MAG: hypothetical protein BWY95_01337 [Bacteroidetes bacterium ADurb.BinA104]
MPDKAAGLLEYERCVTLFKLTQQLRCVGKDKSFLFFTLTVNLLADTEQQTQLMNILQRQIIGVFQSGVFGMQRFNL